MVTRPTPAIASRALAARLVRTWSTCYGSIRTRPASADGRPRQLDVFADRAAAACASDAADRGVQVEDPRRHHLAAGEAEELAREVRWPAAAAAVDRFEIAAHADSPGRLACSASSTCPVITLSMLLKSWATPPASRPTDSIFCACVSCSCSRMRSASAALAVGDVLRAAHGAHRMPRLALAAKEGLRPHLEPAQLAVRPDEAVLDVVEPVRLRRVRAPDGLDNPRSIVGVDPQHAVGAVGARMPRQRLVDGEAGDAPQLGRPVALVGQVIVVEDADVRDANRLVEPLLALAQRLLGPRPVAHVAERGHEPGQGRSGIVDARDRAGDRKAEAVAGDAQRLPRPVRAHVHRAPGDWRARRTTTAAGRRCRRRAGSPTAARTRS